jgi:hypothetical protein
MRKRKNPTYVTRVPYHTHTCGMPGCDRPAHMHCSDGKYYCCLNCQLARPDVMPPHATHCEAYVAKLEREGQR